MKNIVMSTDAAEHRKISVVKRKLCDDDLFKKLLNNYVSSTLKEFEESQEYFTKIFLHLHYFINNDKIYIFFYSSLLTEISVNNPITQKFIEILFNQLKQKSIENKTLLPLYFTPFIINFKNSKIIKTLSDLLQNECLNNILFKINNTKIEFYQKYCKIYSCNIDDMDTEKIKDIIEKIKDIYLLNCKNRIKVGMYIRNGYFKHPSSIYSIIKIFFDNGYLLDVCFQGRAPIESEVNLKRFHKDYKYVIIDRMDKCLNKDFILNKDLKIILIPLIYTQDCNTHFVRSENMKLYLKSRNTQLIRYIRPCDSMESIISLGFVHKCIGYNGEPGPWEIHFNEKKKYNQEISEIMIPEISKTNKGLINKFDFYRLMNLNIEKKTIIIFLVWPVIDFDAPSRKIRKQCGGKIFRPQFLNFEYNLYSKKSILFKIIDSLKKKYNVLIKFHPSKTKVRNGKLYINNGQGTGATGKAGGHNMKLNNIKSKNNWGICNIMEKYNNLIVDYKFHNEALNHSDVGIMFYPSSVQYHSGLFNLPIINISTKNQKDDWFKWHDLKSYINKKDFIQVPGKWRNLEFIEHKIDNKKLFNIKDVCFGDYVYIEDLLTNFDYNLYNIVEKNMAKKYKNNKKMFLDYNNENLAHKLINTLKKKYIDNRK